MKNLLVDLLLFTSLQKVRNILPVPYQQRLLLNVDEIFHRILWKDSEPFSYPRNLILMNH